VYGCFFTGLEQYEAGDKVVLPASFIKFMALLELSPPFLFCVAPSPLPAQTAERASGSVLKPRALLAGVQEFTAPRGEAYIPYWMMQCLGVDEGARLQVLSVPQGLLPPAAYVRLRPHSSALTQILADMGPREVMEVAMRQYSALVAGQVLSLTLPGLPPLDMDVLQVHCTTEHAIAAQANSERWSVRQVRRCRRQAGASTAAAAAAMASGAGGEAPRTPPTALLAPLLAPPLPTSAQAVAARVAQRRAQAVALPPPSTLHPQVPAALLYGSLDLEVDFAPAADVQNLASHKPTNGSAAAAAGSSKVSRLRRQVGANRGAVAAAQKSPSGQKPAVQQSKGGVDITAEAPPSPDDVLFATAAAEAMRRRVLQRQAAQHPPPIENQEGDSTAVGRCSNSAHDTQRAVRALAALTRQSATGGASPKGAALSTNGSTRAQRAGTGHQLQFRGVGAALRGGQRKVGRTLGD